MPFGPFVLAAVIILILLLPFMLFILAHIARWSGQDEWDRAEQARHQHLAKRPYTQRYVDALDGEPDPRRPRVQTSKSKRNKRIRPFAVRRGVVANDYMYAVIRGFGDDVGGEQARLAALGVENPPPEVRDRSDRLDSSMGVHMGGVKVKRGAKIDQLWFERV